MVNPNAFPRDWRLVGDEPPAADASSQPAPSAARRDAELLDAYSQAVIGVVERRGRFQNELVIASHFSTRYHGKRIRELVERAMPDMLDGRLHLWL